MDIRKTILLIDDEQEILDLYSAALIREGYDVITALDGMIGIALAKEKKPDLILLDLKMPGIDGVEVLSRLKNDPETSHLNIVFLTAFSDPQEIDVDAKFAKEMGATDFLKKGIGLDEFIKEIKKYFSA